MDMQHEWKWELFMAIVIAGSVAAYRVNAETSGNAAISKTRPLPALNLQLRGTSVSTDATQSIALIEDGRTHEVRAFHIGDVVQGQQLTSISAGAITLLINGAPVPIEIWHEPILQSTHVLAHTSPGPATWAGLLDGLQRSVEPLDASTERQLRAAVRARSSTERVVNRRAVLAVLAHRHAFQLVREATLEPLVDAGGLRGIKLRGVPSRGFLRYVGLEEGDTIRAIDGVLPTTFTDAIQLPEKLKQQDRIEVQLERQGRSVVLQYQLQGS